ncbi:MAG: DUF4159 domain-containing protein [Gemmatimonadetes bacterium]|nr:DUF4159 domain-containing protein [Gemmatimonadota bacterium]MYD13756.1 DUF4159 domain-containing protein [Gemmatimonadota bacterium]
MRERDAHLLRSVADGGRGDREGRPPVKHVIAAARAVLLRFRCSRGLLCLAAAILATAALAEPLTGQWRGYGTRWVTPRKPDEAAVPGEFTFCRLQYTTVRRERHGRGWRTDYPDADHNLPFRASQMTTLNVARDEREDPFHAVVTASDNGLYACPFLFASDVGTARFSELEVVRLRDYLLKGGFFWADDFWGDYAWSNWAIEMERVLPGYAIREIPMDHPIFHTLYSVDSIPQIPSIQYWRESGRSGTSERGSGSAIYRMYGIEDDSGRLMVIMTHNTDIADGWEREGEEDEFFYRFSPNAYAIGFNVIMYFMTH